MNSDAWFGCALIASVVILCLADYLRERRLNRRRAAWLAHCDEVIRLAAAAEVLTTDEALWEMELGRTS